MKQITFFQLSILLAVLCIPCNGQSCPCTTNNLILQCNVTSNPSVLNIDLCTMNGANSIDIKYSGIVVLNLTSSSTKSIVIEPVDANNQVLQISNINTKANFIQINIRLSNAQNSLPLFTASSSVVAPSSTVTVNVIQNIYDAINFTIFTPSSKTTMNFANFVLMVNSTSSNVGSLYLPYLILGLTNLNSVTISGNGHILSVKASDMPQSNNINRLSLQNLVLYDQILINFTSLTQYSITQCTFNRTSLFLNSTQNLAVSLEMMNNNPIDLVLPFRDSAFSSLLKLTSLTLIEPKLNATSLYAIKSVNQPSIVLINLGSYDKASMTLWGQQKPLFGQLIIQNIKTLDIFPPAFFSNFFTIRQVTLQGTFSVQKTAIAAFVGITKGVSSLSPIVILNTNISNWDNCANTYIIAINQVSSSDIECGDSNTNEECQLWSDETAQCDLITYENTYASAIAESRPDNFFYNNSVLYYFFQSHLWLTRTQSSTSPSPPASNNDGVHIGAIIGALCGLLVAGLILGLTIYFICRARRNRGDQYVPAAPQIKQIRSSSDPANVSIATSKTSKSSRYALENSFFPTIQPNDEIAPPLYTAPSESVTSRSVYQLPSAPPAPTHRDSVSTHATHIYETVDS